MSILLNRVIKIILILYITIMSIALIAYGACFFINKFSADMIKSITTLEKGYIIKLKNFEFKFPVLFDYLDLILGGFFIPEILILISGFVYLKFMNGKFGYSVSIKKLQFIKRLILIAYILKCLTITSNRVDFSLTENLWLFIVLFLLEKDIVIVKNMHDKHWEKIIKEEKKSNYECKSFHCNESPPF